MTHERSVSRLELMAIGLNPERWETDCLYADDGDSVWPGPARLLPGIEEMDLESRGAVVAA